MNLGFLRTGIGLPTTPINPAVGKSMLPPTHPSRRGARFRTLGPTMVRNLAPLREGWVGGNIDFPTAGLIGVVGNPMPVRRNPRFILVKFGLQQCLGIRLPR